MPRKLDDRRQVREIKKMLSTLAIIFAISLVLPAISFARNGKLLGRALDAESGEPIIGASVYIEGTTMGAATDINGYYVIDNIPEGVYTLIISSVAYDQLQVQDVNIVGGAGLKLDYALQPKTLQVRKITVTAQAVKNTESSLLKERQRSRGISDAISSEAIARSGSGDAAQAMTKVTGASVVSGRYIYIRGLGGRYSNARLNGSMIPSADPDAQAVPMDLFPANLLDNIVVEKSFSPNKPGNFSGGSVNLRTKEVLEEMTLSFSSSASYNSSSSLNGNFLSAPRGGTDWLAFDNGFRGLPEILSDPNLTIPSLGSSSTNLANAYKLDSISKSFSSTMNPIHRLAPLNQNYAFSLGNSLMFLGRPLGYLGSLTYGHSYSFYDDGKVGRWTLTGAGASILGKDYLLDDTRGKEEVLWGGMVNLNYSLHQNHKISLQTLYNRQGEQEARYICGEVEKDGIIGDSRFETRTIKYSEQSMRSVQLNGEHMLSNIRLNWKAALNGSSREEPDLRYFSDDYVMEEDGDSIIYYYNISLNLYDNPTHYYRWTDEDYREGQVDFSIPLAKRFGKEVKFGTGAFILNQKRTTSENRYKVKWSQMPEFNGDPDDFLSAENMGIDTILISYYDQNGDGIDDTLYRFVFGNYIARTIEPANNFEGRQDVAALYGMIDMPLLPRLNLAGGVRLESTEMSILSGAIAADSSQLIDSWNYLPSASFTYELKNDMNLRLAYGRTLARPTIRELSPMETYDFVKGYRFVGNPQLKHTLIDNIDLRWEWYAEPGEILAFSAFAKEFHDPIEKAIINNNNNVQYKNSSNASVYGLEFEARKKLEIIHESLRNFQFEGNLTLTHSEVRISDFELMLRRAFDPNASDKRPLQGQSPYIVNAGLMFTSTASGISAALLYNVFGRRLSEVSEGGTPDVYEYPQPSLDFSFSKRIVSGLNLKFMAKNILDSGVRKLIEYKGKEYVFQQYSTGQSFSLGLSYSI
jgi:outer membrane receptor protein involved in Fe transport